MMMMLMSMTMMTAWQGATSQAAPVNAHAAIAKDSTGNNPHLQRNHHDQQH